MSDAKVHIDAGNELHGAVVETNSYIVNISRQYARIYSYDDYLVSAGVVAPTAQPTSLTFSNVTTTTMDVSFTASVGGADGYVAFRRTGASPTFVPVDTTTYTVGNTYGDSTCQHFGADVTFSESGLSAYTQYFYDVYAWNGDVGTYAYLGTSPLENSKFTLFDFNNALRFDGTNDRCTFTDTNFGQVQSFEFWIKFDAITQQKVLISRVASPNSSIAVNTNGTIQIRSSTTLTATSPATAILDGSWHHVVITRNLRVVRIYFDGSNTGGNLDLGSDVDLALDSFGCYRGSSNFFDGVMDEFRIYGNYVLSDAQVLAQYNSGTGASVLTKAADAGDIFWSMNQVNSNTTLADASGNGKTLTLLNFNFNASSGWEAH